MTGITNISGAGALPQARGIAQAPASYPPNYSSAVSADFIGDCHVLPRDDAKQGQPALVTFFYNDDNKKTENTLYLAKNSMGRWDAVIHTAATSYLGAQLEIRDLRNAIEAAVPADTLSRDSLRVVTPFSGEQFERQRSFDRGCREDLLALRRLYINDISAEALPTVMNAVADKLGNSQLQRAEAKTAVTDFINGVADGEKIKGEAGFRFAMRDVFSRITGKGPLLRTSWDLFTPRGRFAMGHYADLINK